MKSNKKIYLLGCSFTYHFDVKYLESKKHLRDRYDIINLGASSRSNFQILEDIRNLEDNSIAIIQWSSLSRPSNIKHSNRKNWNRELNKIAKQFDNPLLFYVDIFIKTVKEGENLLKKKNIKSFQYIGWAQWSNNEINSEYEKILKELPITWFSHDKVIDTVGGSCWHYEGLKNFSVPIIKSDNEKPYEWIWYPNKWGGMSEWIRNNVKNKYNRWVAIEKNHGHTDPHPNEHSGDEFYKAVIIPEIEKLINDE